MSQGPDALNLVVVYSAHTTRGGKKIIHRSATVLPRVGREQLFNHGCVHTVPSSHPPTRETQRVVFLQSPPPLLIRVRIRRE